MQDGPKRDCPCGLCSRVRAVEAALATVTAERDRYRTALELIREMGRAWARGEWPERDAAVARLQALAAAAPPEEGA